MALHDHPLYNPELIWANDDATLEGGFAAATYLRNCEVAIVIGHYASAAARGALPVYREAGIPLLLPAATADRLTNDYSNAFRLCSNDTKLAKYIYKYLLPLYQNAKIAILEDGSVHGRSLSQKLGAWFEGIATAGIEKDTAAVIFTGSYANSIQFVQQCRQQGHSQPVYLTDDAVHTDIIKDLGHNAGDIFVFGYADASCYFAAKAVNAKYHALYKTGPQTYFIQTYAAMQIALACSAERGFGRTKIERLNTGTWETVLGETNFVNQECPIAMFSLWQANAGHGLYILQ